MKSLICPISAERVNSSVVRTTAFLIAAVVALYAVTGGLYLMVILAVDFYIRAFTSLKYSPFSWVAARIAGGLSFPVHKIDKAPKIFAARVGFLFAVATVFLHFTVPVAALVTGLILMTFALLESLLDVCAGCIVYTYIVLPIFRRA